LSFADQPVVPAKLIEVLKGSVVRKKVILDGRFETATSEGSKSIVKTVRTLKVACETKGIKLWRKIFSILLNGKVDLNPK
jgi:hypothetical protein